MEKKIQVFQATFDIDACMKEIRECLEKGWTGVGFKTVQFEEMWKTYTGLPNAYYVNSATAGLNLAFDILKTENNWTDGEVITTPLTFVSTNHAILLAGGGGLKPIFADVDDTLCLDPDDVERKITPKTKAVCFVGFGGSTGQYERIVDICKKHNLKFVLDAAHMAGTRLNGQIPGKEADAVIYSFQAVKNLPTGDSGMLCFNNASYDTIARQRGWLGINKDTYARMNSGNYKWKYDVEYVGNKYHGNSIMAAIAIAQLPHLERDNAYRRQLASWYEETLSIAGDKIKFIPIPDGCESSRHLFQIMVTGRDDLLRYLNENNVFPGVHYIINTEYRMYSYAKGTCPKAEYASEHILSLPMHMRVTHSEVEYITNLILKFVTKKELQ
jgi:dTDP-4-amino-4,6-dideoxygalactose transaminase